MKINPPDVSIKARKSEDTIKLNCLGFADDLAFLTNSIAEARVQLTSLVDIAGKIG